MNITLKLTANAPIVLPIDYNHIVQSVIYNSISQNLANFLHDQGFLGKRQGF